MDFIHKSGQHTENTFFKDADGHHFIKMFRQAERCD